MLSIEEVKQNIKTSNIKLVSYSSTICVDLPQTLFLLVFKKNTDNFLNKLNTLNGILLLTLHVC